jgi:hypothetical protein
MRPTKSERAAAALEAGLDDDDHANSGPDGDGGGGAHAAGVVDPSLVDINRASMYDLLQLRIPGLGEKTAERLIAARHQRWLVKKVRFNDARAGAAPSTTSSSSSAAAASSRPQCDCPTPESCGHVRAFSRLKSLATIDGIGSKTIQRLEEKVRV